MKRIGYLSPGSVNTLVDDVSVREAQEANCVTPAPQPSYQEQNVSQANYEKSTGFQKDDFVYLDYKQKTFSKSFDLQVSNMTSLHSKKIYLI